VDGFAEAALRARRRGEAARLPQDKVHAIWVRARLLRRNDAGDAAMDAAFLRKNRQSPCACRACAGRHRLGSKGAGLRASRARRDRRLGKVVAYEFLSKGFSRQQIATNESDPADSLVGLATGVAPKGTQIFGVPAESYGFENKLLAWETIPPLSRRLLAASHLAPARSGRSGDPFRLGAVHRRAGARGRRGPGGIPAEVPDQPRHQAVVKARPRRRLGVARQGQGHRLRRARRHRGGGRRQVEVDATSGASGRGSSRSRTTAAGDQPAGAAPDDRGQRGARAFATLFEEVRFNRDAVTSIDWASYPILEMQDAPSRST
jgi:hypothetical protein